MSSIFRKLKFPYHHSWDRLDRLVADTSGEGCSRQNILDALSRYDYGEHFRSPSTLCLSRAHPPPLGTQKEKGGRLWTGRRAVKRTPLDAEW